MSSQDAHSLCKAIAVLLMWIGFAVAAALFMLPPWEVMKTMLVGLSPFIVAAATLAVGFLVSLLGKRGRRSTPDRADKQQR
jgi:VIT1/CCC1 family predicted Fe2+/Mn2+ transporter